MSPKSIFALTLIAIHFTISFAGCSTKPAPSAAEETKPQDISVRLPIPAVRPSMGPFFAAQEYGWYSKQGLKVSLNYGAESTNPVAMVLSGSDQIGVLGGPDTVLVAVGKGAPLVIVAIMHKDSNMPCVITKRDSGITNVAQLADKRVGMFKGHISTDVLRNWFRRTGVKVTEVDVGYDYSQFLNSQIDAQWAFTTAAAVELEEKGIPVNVLNPSVDGIYTHGFTIFTTKDFLAAHPDRVRGFLAATFEGITKMHDSPDEISKLVTSRDTTGNLQVDQVRRRIDQYNTFSPSFNPLPPGYFNKKMISDTYDRLLEEGVIEKPFPVENAYTTKFLAEIHGEKYTP